MSTPLPSQQRRSAGECKKSTPPTSIITRNGARKAKIQTRAMSAGTKPSSSLLAAKKKAQLRKKQFVDTVLKDYYQIAMLSKTKVKGATGVVTDPRMAEHRCIWDDNYPECPERLIGVIERCKELNLLEECKMISPRAATKDELAVLHSSSVYDMLETTHQNNDHRYLEELSSKYDAIYIHPSTHELALLAAGSTITLVDQIVSGELQNGFALVRPPGHHAMKAEPCGYCFYNNVALAAKHAIHKHGLERILIVDWDVHHGQATQQMFYNDPRVLYFSIHRYEHGSFWPNLRQSDFMYAGGGRNVNVPLNCTGMGDGDYLAIWHQLLLPMAFEFSPELIIISAGYDSALGDDKGQMEVTPACYATLTHLLMSACSAVCCVLEGGYCVPALADGAAHTLRTLQGHPPPAQPPPRPPNAQIQETILNCIYVHKPYWNCFNYQPTYSVDDTVKNVCDGEKEKHVVELRWEGDETRPDRFATRDCYPVQDDATKKQLLERLNMLKISLDLTVPQHEVAYIYDTAMLKHKNICEPGHVECPERIMRIHERHRDYGLLERVHMLNARPATDEEILSTHSQEHLDMLKKLSTTKLRDLHAEKDKFESVYFHPESLKSASVAIGSALEMVQAVCEGVVGCGVCVSRPPGHHAAAGPAGFCMLNAAATAARYVASGRTLPGQAASSQSVPGQPAGRPARVLLLDWDVHHGNGTQSLTYASNQILYISIHRYDNGTFFPHSKEADYTRVGAPGAEGFNVNIPWNKRGMGDAEYLAAFTQIVLPIATEFNPDLVIVSAGFDACVQDPLGDCKVTPECFGRMTHMLRSLAGGKVVLILEGGYNITSISYAMTMCTKALLGDPIAYQYNPKPVVHWSAIETINNVISTHKKYWKSLQFQKALPVENVLGELPPSRGLELLDPNTSLGSEKLAELSISGSSDMSNCSKNLSANQDGYLECQMNNLCIGKPKCEDGLHCGTDDEEESPKSSNSQAGKYNEEPGCSQSSSFEPKNEAGSSKVEKSGTLVDYLADNMQDIVDGKMFAVVPLPWCPHLDSLATIPEDVKFEQGVKCVDCEETSENWVCLHCFINACGRSVNGHMQDHLASSGHSLVLSLQDLSVWCNECDSYVDNPSLFPARNNAHQCKFHEDMPWCYKSDTIDME